MPQMSPLWWEILFLIFIITYFMVMILLYFNFKKEFKKNSINNKIMNQLYWKW
uniref:ATP synthase complex subunit 8 n=1 Tax=Nezara viridula TaxID=85310 RepID=B7S639_NEZVI|nr:ATP synthase F0 subunit 8 [Nezara viridula]ABM63308.1 ATP synthase F0 subunit 8 [Nezara viridula]